ncbi:MAG: acyl carrier protein [Lachnospiraceae bacterium]|nr:acyl carrier protein [Lachnospiraceae bacterium]
MLEKVREVIAEQLGLDAVEITEDTSFKDDLGADSLDLFELIMAFEEEYDMEIPTEDLENLSTVGDLIEYMKSIGIDA